MNSHKTITLNNGLEIPRLGLGTWQITGKAVEQAVFWALESGYRHIDTAKIYGNEREIGNAIKKFDIPREELFITTKLWNTDHDDPIKAFNESRLRLDVDYIDLYLIHWPMKERIPTWKVFETLLKTEKCRAIGVSNFTVNHLKEILENAQVVPAVNQVEFTPYLYQKDLLEFCRAKGIVVEAYSPLTRGRKLDDPKLVKIANKNNKSSAQILIRWALQHNLVVIPKSKTKERIEENFKVFDFNISEEDMKILDSFNEDRHFCWDPNETT